MQRNHPIFHRISQLIGFLLGARFFVTLLLTFALYVSTFFLFSREEGFRQFVFDFKVHGIIFCAVLSILCGGMINQFYDRDKDKLTKPFTSKLQNFIKQKYFLYAYLLLCAVSLIIAWFISLHVFIFFVAYQFLMWFYSHKLSKILFLNNLTFVALSLYPFFGMLIYYQRFSLRILVMAIFLFLILLAIDILKDMLTKNADKVFGYQTLANRFGNKISRNITVFLLSALSVVGIILSIHQGFHLVMSWYFLLTSFMVALCVFLLFSNRKNTRFYTLNILRLWVFIGILAMLADGITSKFAL